VRETVPSQEGNSSSGDVGDEKAVRDVPSGNDVAVSNVAGDSPTASAPAAADGITVVHTDPGEDGSVVASGSGTSLRLWCSFVIGCIVSLPFAWLLSYASYLPFYLGLFFFVLFGVVIGAVVFRVAAPRRPYGTTSLVIGTVLVVSVGWTASLIKEARDFPGDMAVKAGKRTRSIGDQTIREYEAAVASDIRRFLKEQYPPGGTIGYVRWVVKSGRLKKGEVSQVGRTLRPLQSGYVWVTRIVLSLLLLIFGVSSQTLALRRAVDTPLRAMDANRDADSS